MTAPRVTKIEPLLRTDVEILDLVEQFEACRWPYENWTHRAHLAVAIVYLTRLSFPDALARMRRNIQAYNATRADTKGYHETITVFFLQCISAYLAAQRRRPSFAAALAELAKHLDVNAPLEFYSADLLWSAEARKQWIEPDLKPLPAEYSILHPS